MGLPYFATDYTKEFTEILNSDAPNQILDAFLTRAKNLLSQVKIQNTSEVPGGCCTRVSTEGK